MALVGLHPVVGGESKTMWTPGSDVRSDKRVGQIPETLGISGASLEVGWRFERGDRAVAAAPLVGLDVFHDGNDVPC